MDKQNLQLAAGFVSRTYVQVAEQALSSRRALVKSLLSQRRLPAEGWDDLTIEAFIQAMIAALCLAASTLHAAITVTHHHVLQDVALMDSNNFPHPVGVGEREARVASGLVARRHYGLAHGIGRSGNIAAEQPKVSTLWPWPSGHHLSTLTGSYKLLPVIHRERGMLAHAHSLQYFQAHAGRVRHAMPLHPCCPTDQYPQTDAPAHRRLRAPPCWPSSPTSWPEMPCGWQASQMWVLAS